MLRKLKLEEACQQLGVDHEVFTQFVREQWVCPAEPESFDHEDVARARLIVELREEFGVNDEAIPLILHLLDQVYALRAALQNKAS